MDDARLALIGRLLAEAARRKVTADSAADSAREALEAELRAMAERLAATGGALPRGDASIAERLAVLLYLPQSDEAETARETAEINAWLVEHGYPSLA
jgi:hypothetical protein